MRWSPPGKSGPGFPSNTCEPRNSIKDSSSHLEPVSRADLPGDSPCKKLENATIKPEKLKKKCANFYNESFPLSTVNTHVPFSWKSPKDSEVPQVRLFLFLSTTEHAHFISKHIILRGERHRSVRRRSSDGETER